MFVWVGCLDGSSINLSSVDAFVVGQVEMKDDNDVVLLDAEGKPRVQYCVYAVIGGNQFPLRVCNNPRETQIVIQGVLGNMKKEFDKFNPRREVLEATPEERKVVLG